jgi:hypothetical protein
MADAQVAGDHDYSYSVGGGVPYSIKKRDHAGAWSPVY